MWACSSDEDLSSDDDTASEASLDEPLPDLPDLPDPVEPAAAEASVTDGNSDGDGDGPSISGGAKSSADITQWQQPSNRPVILPLVSFDGLIVLARYHLIGSALVSTRTQHRVLSPGRLCECTYSCTAGYTDLATFAVQQQHGRAHETKAR